MQMNQDCGPSGESLLLIALLVSFQLAQNRSTEELELLAAFFSVLGDNLALIAVRRANQEETCAEQPSDTKSDTESAKCIDKSVQDV